VKIPLRIIPDQPRPPAFNMAADLFMLRRCVEDQSVYLRLYTWEPPAVSLGCMQDPLATLDTDALQRDGIAWVRRPTGGRAVLHLEDLTYSVAFPHALSAMGSTIAESYAAISRCIACGLRLAGVTTESHDSGLDAAEVRRDVKLPCFLAPNRDETMVDGRKLVGSAQKRTAEAVLQHGSIPLTGAFARLPEYLRISEEQRARQRDLLRRKCAWVDLVRPGLGAAELGRCIADGFVETLHANAAASAWAPEEMSAIAEMSGDASVQRV